jgi:hypothetical protein
MELPKSLLRESSESLLTESPAGLCRVEAFLAGPCRVEAFPAESLPEPAPVPAESLPAGLFLEPAPGRPGRR